MLLILSAWWNPTFAQESSSENRLVASDPKIKLEKYVGFGYEYELTGLKYNPTNATFVFTLINYGNTTIENIRIIPSALTAEKRPQYSNTSSYIGADEIKVEPREIPALVNGSEQKISYTLDRELIKRVEYSEVTYEGQLQIIRSNADPISIPVTVSFRVDGYADLFAALIGVAAAVFAGLAYMRWEQRKKIDEKAADDSDIISDINGYIRSINAYRYTFDPEAWNNLYQAYSEKRQAIEKYRDQIDLDPEAEAVKWFRLIDDQIRENNLAFKNKSTNNRPLPEIDRPGGTEYNKLKKTILEKRKHEQYQNDKEDRAKKLYLLVTAIIASVAALVTEVTFLGNSILNFGIAIAIGFGVYRAQDLLKLFPSKSED